MKIAIERVQGVDVEHFDMLEWGEVFSDWNKPRGDEFAVGESIVFVITRTE